MNEHEDETREESHEAGGPRRVKVTDRRRVQPDTGGPSTDAPPTGDDAAEPAPGPAEQVDDLEAARRSAAEYRDHLQRLAADFDNYRKRVLKEQTRAVEMASEPLMRRLIEVLDEFDLALIAAGDKPELDRFLRGVELVYAKLVEILRQEGLERIEAQGKPFDPELHEALMQSGDADGDPFVADVLRQGYTLRGRVVRPAGVKVVRR